jgi:hypothetical protein
MEPKMTSDKIREEGTLDMIEIRERFVSERRHGDVGL